MVKLICLWGTREVGRCAGVARREAAGPCSRREAALQRQDRLLRAARGRRQLPRWRGQRRAALLCPASIT
jgi:hypothetical protein